MTMKVMVWRRLKTSRLRYVFLLFSLLFVILVCKQSLDGYDFVDHGSSIHPGRSKESRRPQRVVTLSTDADKVYFDRDIPLIWIGGVPRSGTTLMRAMLDAHPEVRCGAETRVIPRILNMHHWLDTTDFERNWLADSRLTNDTLERALGAYLLTIISGHGPPAPRLCNKDPFALRSIGRLHRVFPRSKFLLMIRDGRATVHSIVSRKVTIRGFDFRSYRGALADWNRVVETMFAQCVEVGSEFCLPVYYERLVLRPKPTMIEVLRFLGVPWNDAVLHHDTMIGREGGVFLSKKEFSSDQVRRPINTDSLVTWVEHIPDDVRVDVKSIAPMMDTLGYMSDVYPPNYENLLNGDKNKNNLIHI